MELEIKHLAAYLPYKIDAEMLDYEIDYVGKQFDAIIGVEQWDKNGMYWSALTVGGSKPSLKSIKPILRNLSDLTKEIEHNGEKFVPYHRLQEYFSNRNFDGVRLYQNRIYTNTLYLTDAQLLLSWHFDIFNLIPNNLAIDINTIKQ